MDQAGRRLAAPQNPGPKGAPEGSRGGRESTEHWPGASQRTPPLTWPLILQRKKNKKLLRLGIASCSISSSSRDCRKKQLTVPEPELKPTSFNFQNPNAKVPPHTPSRLLKPSESKWNTITLWWPLPGIAGVCPESWETDLGPHLCLVQAQYPTHERQLSRHDVAGA